MRSTVFIEREDEAPEMSQSRIKHDTVRLTMRQIRDAREFGREGVNLFLDANENTPDETTVVVDLTTGALMLENPPPVAKSEVEPLVN